MDIDQQGLSRDKQDVQLEHLLKSAILGNRKGAISAPAAWIERHPFCTGAALPNTPQRHAYLRVSTADQNTDRQIVGLEKLCDQLHIEYASAVANTRPVFDALIERLKPGDTFTVWDLDRAFRSTLDAILTADSLRARGVQFKIVSMQVDTTTPEGELFYTILAGFAQYERRIISRRTIEGMDAARRKGKSIGRPRALTAEKIRAAYEWIIETDYPCGYVAALLGVSRITLQRGFRRHGLVAITSARA